MGGYLRRQGFSRHVLASVKRGQGGISLGGKAARMRDVLQKGDCLVVDLAEEGDSPNVVPTALPLSIVYEDADVLVVDKQADMPVHPSMGNYANTLANALAFYFQERGESFVFRCITRLDRDTTGLVLVAKHAFAASLLSTQVANREISRTYRAIVLGTPPESGTIDAPIARKEGSVLERVVDFARGERAVTHYRTLGSARGHSLVELVLETGRTHQIRVHMKYLGYPVVGDFLYFPDYRLMNRQALHACRLAFCHPVTRERMAFTSETPWEWPIA